MNPSTQNQYEAQEAAEQEALDSAGTEMQMAGAVEGELMDPEEVARKERELQAMRRTMMDAIGTELQGFLSDAVLFRSTYEREWAVDIRQFETGDALDGSAVRPTKQYSSTESWKRVNDNITRFATVTYAARLSDMLFPTSDRNWDIDHTPDPELPPEVMQNLENSLAMVVQQGQMSDEVANDAFNELVLAVARKRVEKMRTKIDDQLAESRYSDQGRKVIMDACKIGHGVMKGPFAKAKKRRRYMAAQGYKAVVEEVLTDPMVTWVDPWMVYPRPCRRIEDCPGVFELHELSAKRVDDLRIQPGFSSEQVDRLLRQGPSWQSVQSTIDTLRSLDEVSLVARNENFAVFEYNGDMPKNAVLLFINQLMHEAKLNEEEAAKLSTYVDESNAVHLNCNVWFSDGIVLKVAVSPVDCDAGMYKFFTFEKHESAPFGKGVPRILRDPQASVRQLWASIHLNAIMSSAPQIGIMKGALEADGGGTDGSKNLSMDKPRVWCFTGDIDDIRKAIQVFTIPSTINGIMPVYERAKQNAQEQTMLPMIAQGEPTQAVPTSSGLAMLMNAANIVQRRLAAEFDMCITTPLIQSMYDWNMQHGPDEAKGDYKIIARASSHLLVKDIQAQHFFTALNLYASNPKLEPRMRWDAWAEEGMKMLDMSASRFLLSEEEFEKVQQAAAQNQPQDPATIRAQAAMQDSQTKAKTADINAQIAQEKLALQREDRALDAEDRIEDRENQRYIADVALQGKLAALDVDAQGRVMEVQAKLRSDAERNSTQARIAGMKAAERAQDRAVEIQRDQFEAKVEANTSPGPRLA